MKNTEIRDERIILQRRKIQSDAYQILVFCLLASVLIQMFFLKAPFLQFAVEFFCIIGMGLYIAIRHLTIGIDIWNSTEQSNRKLIVNGLVSGIISTGMLAVLAGEKNIWHLLSFLVAFSVCYFMMHIIIRFFNKKKKKQIDETFSDTDE